MRRPRDGRGYQARATDSETEDHSAVCRDGTATPTPTACIAPTATEVHSGSSRRAVSSTTGQAPAVPQAAEYRAPMRGRRIDVDLPRRDVGSTELDGHPAKPEGHDAADDSAPPGYLDPRHAHRAPKPHPVAIDRVGRRGRGEHDHGHRRGQRSVLGPRVIRLDVGAGLVWLVRLVRLGRQRDDLDGDRRERLTAFVGDSPVAGAAGGGDFEVEHEAGVLPGDGGLAAHVRRGRCVGEGLVEANRDLLRRWARLRRTPLQARLLRPERQGRRRRAKRYRHEPRTDGTHPTSQTHALPAPVHGRRPPWPSDPHGKTSTRTVRATMA